jgi:hypothetical protein
MSSSSGHKSPDASSPTFSPPMVADQSTSLQTLPGHGFRSAPLGVAILPNSRKPASPDDTQAR